jgi:putative acetyltransferase
MRDGKIIGCAVCRDNVIDLMMVDHAVHRQGLGTALLQHVEQMLLQSSPELRLESFEANEKANAFYRKNGWHEVSRYFDEDSDVNKVIFQKAGGRTTRCT